MANNKNGFRDQNSHRFWNQGPTFWSKYGIDNERIYPFTTLWIAKNNTRVLFIYTENSEILVGKWNGTYHSIWNSSDIIGYRLIQCFCFSFLTSQLILVHFVIVDRLTMILWFFHFAFWTICRAACLHPKFPHKFRRRAWALVVSIRLNRFLIWPSLKFESHALFLLFFNNKYT